MRGFSIGLGVVLALGACSATSDEDQLENVIRENLSSQGSVREVEMTKQEDGSMTGHAVIEEPNGRVGRLTCTAEPDTAESKYNWRCSPAIDEQTLREMEEVIRTELSKRGPVLEIEMRRQDDDDHMSGFARVRDEAGEEFRLTCTATRNSGEVGTFSWSCSDSDDEGEAAQES